MVNELRFNFGERRAIFQFAKSAMRWLSIFPAPPSSAANCSRRSFAPKRATNGPTILNIVAGNHTFKFGGDYASVNIPSAVFELNFAGLFNFGGFSATNLAAFPAVGGSAPPDFTPVQQYGLGLPTNLHSGLWQSGQPD